MKEIWRGSFLSDGGVMRTGSATPHLRAVVAFILLIAPSIAHAQAKIVSKGNGRQELTWNGKPYQIKGAGIVEARFLDQLAAAGGNSIRTWGAASDPDLYEAARKLGLTVAAGLWLLNGAELNYSDAAKVKEQHDKLMAYVEKYKNHPAILIWGIGNEMEGAGNDRHLWAAVEQLAQDIHKVAPNHLTMTVLSEVTQTKVAFIKENCPSLDVLGVNSYSSLDTLPARLESFGWNKPWIVTEYGPRGDWQSPKTDWGAPTEQTSTEKEKYYLEKYRVGIGGKTGCLGGYMHLWGFQPFWAGTDNWYGCFARPDGERLGIVDSLTLLWTGKYPANRCPQIISVRSPASRARVAPGGKYLVEVVAKDPEGDPLTAVWEVRTEKPESSQWTKILSGCITQTSGLRAIFKAPEKEGAYRLFVRVKDGKGNAACANFPFYAQSGLAPPASDPDIREKVPDTPVPSAAPFACGDGYVVEAGETLTVKAPGVLANDTDAEGGTPAAAKLAHDYTAGLGKLSFKEDGSFTFAPNEGLPDGTVIAFTYKAVGKRGIESAEAAVVLIVRARK